jgi:hypothetical protein
MVYGPYGYGYVMVCLQKLDISGREVYSITIKVGRRLDTLPLCCGGVERRSMGKGEKKRTRVGLKLTHVSSFQF